MVWFGIESLQTRDGERPTVSIFRCMGFTPKEFALHQPCHRTSFSQAGVFNLLNEKFSALSFEKTHRRSCTSNVALYMQTNPNLSALTTRLFLLLILTPTPHFWIMRSTLPILFASFCFFIPLSPLHMH